MRRLAAMALAGGSAVAGRLAAQTSAVVDQGTFMLARSGAAIGREQFSIIRAVGSGGQVYRAEARSSLGDLRLQSTLATDSLGSPVSYEERMTQRGEQVELIQGRGRPRFSLLLQTKGGEAGGEYRIRQGTVIVDEQLFHQFYFLALAALRTPDSLVTVISPREVLSAADGSEHTQSTARLVFRGVEGVPVGTQTLTGRRFALTDNGTLRAELWIDAAGRLLKVSVPDKSLVALRDDPPR
ncbi:MAG TPA: hypothetical protein VF483_05230 [Gemmatimonadaceae bacterium]